MNIELLLVFFLQIQIPVWDFNGIVEMKIGFIADYSSIFVCQYPAKSEQQKNDYCLVCGATK